MKPTLSQGYRPDRTPTNQVCFRLQDRVFYAVRTSDGGCQVKRPQFGPENILIESDQPEVRTEVALDEGLKKLIIGGCLAWRNLLEI